jgi:pimeloyl-ACP methyl ester carboxylesterase
LQRIDPGRRVLALDLPGHDESPDWTSYDIESVADGVHRAVEQAQLQSPVVVGHSISAVIATVYAARYPSSGVINIDQSLQVAPFANLVRSLADKLRGPNFPALWENFAAGMQIELLPESAQALVRSTSRPRQELVVAYWRELLARPTEELADLAAAALTTVRDAGLPYLVVAGNPLEPGYQQWLTGMLPQVKITVWPGEVSACGSGARRRRKPCSYQGCRVPGMEHLWSPAGRNRWQPLANGTPPKTAQTAARESGFRRSKRPSAHSDPAWTCSNRRSRAAAPSGEA